ncbi:MAG: hypothetical protein ACT4P3_14600 [Betaproteobacteria bacterium]
MRCAGRRVTSLPAMRAYRLPSTLARAIAEQHRLGGELFAWVKQR